jgi:hypothetical protein
MLLRLSISVTKLCREKISARAMRCPENNTTIHRVKCVICSTMKGSTITMGPTSETLEKHAGKTLAMKDLSEGQILY